MADIELPPLPDWMSRFQIPADNLDDSDFSWLDSRMKDYARTAVKAALEAAQADAERWRYIRRKLCLAGNGDGTCAIQAFNLPAAIQGWPEPGKVAEFCDAAIDAAMRKENSND